MSFANQLKQKMDEQNISQSELAARIGKGKSSVSQYLSGKNIPKREVQEKIAEVLDCTVDSLTSNLNGDIYETKNVSVSECARRLGKSEQFVRVALQTGSVPFGFAVKNRTMYSYHISPKKLEEYIGA